MDLCAMAFLGLLLILVILLVIFDRLSNKKKPTTSPPPPPSLPEPPMPFKLPIVGHLYLMGGYEVPYQAFSHLGKKYGNVVGLQLGSVKCAVINGQKNIRETLVTKGHHFDFRPNFERYRQLFSGNKENSLAFCNWSETQKTRRDMLRAYTFPRAFTNNFNTLDNLVAESLSRIQSKISNHSVHPIDLKPVILEECANIFTNHFCSKHFDDSNNSFTRMVQDFDEIFYEVNQGYAADFLPFLLPFHMKNLKRINNLTHSIRDFVLTEIIGERFDKFNIQFEPNDYVESLIKYVKSEPSDLTWETALFALEDIIGGHSAVGNFLMKLFGFLVKEPEVQAKIQAEIDRVVGFKDARNVSIGDRSHMPYTEATIFEAIRLIASPIVPRVANQNSCIDGFKIDEGTVIFLNNYELSMSKNLWEEPEKFEPSRFIKNDRLVKPEHFLPFGGGRRSCMGYKMVQLISFGILGGLLQHYSIIPASKEQYKVPVGSLALPKSSFKFCFAKR